MGFLEREKFFFKISKDFLESFHSFFFSSPKTSFFFTKSEGVFIGGWVKMGARCSVSGYTTPTPYFYHLIGLFCHFLCFLSDLRAAVWRPFWAPLSSNFIFIESFECLVSNGSNLKRFGATIVEISRSKGR